MELIPVKGPMNVGTSKRGPECARNSSNAESRVYA